MKWQAWPVNYPGEGEVRLKHTAIGVNFADTYHRAEFHTLACLKATSNYRL